MTLTTDQRWLLLHMGGWEIVGALCSPEGVTRLMQSCWGSTGGHTLPPGAPAWLKGWETSGSIIKARGRNVTVKATEINRYAKTIPDNIKAELIDCRNAGTANAVLRSRHCYCGDPKRRHTQKDVICRPTAAQEREATDEYWRIHEWQNRVLATALGLDGNSHIGGDQLDLFEVGA